MGRLLETDTRAFRMDFTGTLLTASDVAYEKARSVWNGAIDRRPGAIAQCATPSEVAAAIAFARRQGLEISVRGGGHNFAGFAVNDGGLMIDLSPMRQVTVDPTRRRAVTGGGATWFDFDAATQEHGLAVTGGFVSHTGVGGLTLGGGIGWLTRNAGLSIDNLLSAELVTADGRTVRASADENADLLWGLCGGGGNFGVVTSFEFRLHEVGPLCHLGFFFWTADRGDEALRFMREYMKALPEQFGVLIAGISAPPTPFVPAEHQGATGYALLVGGFGSPEEHAKAVKPIRAAGPTFEFVTPIPYVNLQQLFDEGNPWGLLGYEKAVYLDELTDDAIDVITERLPQKNAPLSFMPIFVLGGAYARVADDETAFGGSRSARFSVNIAALCTDADLFREDRAWVRSFWDALVPHSSGVGSYVNFMSEYEEDRIRASYGPAKFERLARLKADYDPDNVFHLNANIKPMLQPA